MNEADFLQSKAEAEELSDLSDRFEAAARAASGAGRVLDKHHAHGSQLCDPSEETATAGVTPYRDAVDAVLAYGAEPPEYPGMVLVPATDIAALRSARDRMEALG